MKHVGRRLRWLAVAVIIGVLSFFAFLGEAIMAVFDDDIDFGEKKEPQDGDSP